MKNKIFFILIFVVAISYNNSNMYIQKKVWLFDEPRRLDFGTYMIFTDGFYSYKWPYIYKYNKKVAMIVVCISNNMLIYTKSENPENDGFFWFVGM